MSLSSTPDEIHARAQGYCQGLLVKYVQRGARFITTLDEDQRDLLVGFLMEAYCQGGIDSLKELSL